MKNIWLLAKANMNKGKGQSFSFFLVILIAAILMNAGLVVWLNYDVNFERQAKKNNAADAFFIGNVEADSSDTFLKLLKDDQRVETAESREVLYAMGQYQYSVGEQSKGAVFLKKDDTISIGHVDYLELSDKTYEDPIYLPYLFQTGGGYRLGDEFEIRLITVQGEKTFRYQVAGFFDETFMGSINSTVSGYVLEEEQYRELSEVFAGEIDAVLYQVQVSDREDGQAVASAYAADIQEIIRPGGLYDTNYFENIKSARTITSSIGALLIVAFSIIIVAVSLIIVKFRIANSIEEDMKNIGALKAIGYTNRQTVCGYLLQFVSLAFAGNVFGVAVSYLILPVVSDLFAAQTGILWEQPFDISAAGLTMSVLMVLVAAVAYLACQKAGKLVPIAALRSGLNTHSFKKNYCVLDGKPGGLTLRLAGKSFFQNGKYNIMVALIITVVSFATVFAGVMYYNISVDADSFIQLVAGEIPDAQVQIEVSGAAAGEQLMEEISKLPEIEKVYFNETLTAHLDSGSEVYCYVMEDFAAFDYQEILYKGRFPEYDNEIAMGGLLAQKEELEIGDTVAVSVGGEMREFLITGFIQGSNYLGQDACMTQAGWQTLVENQIFTVISIFWKEGTEGAIFLEDLKNRFTGITGTAEVGEIISSSMAVYKEAVAALTAVILAVTVVIVILTLYLVLKTNLIREKGKIGIQKAIGYTTRQLVLQSALSFVPVILISTILGGICAWFLLNPLLSLLFSNLGMMKVTFTIAPLLLIGLMTGINVIGFIVCILVSLRIKRVTPYTLINE